jgi:RimJ/RimL family protein N-acetyltransferase
MLLVSPTIPPPIPQPNFQTIILTTPRLLLRAGVLSDAPALHAIFSNPDVMRYWDTLPHSSLVQTTDWLAKMLASPQNGVTEFVMCLRPSASKPVSAGLPHSKPTESEGLSEAIGKIGIWRDMEIGFLLHCDYWRQGLMREAMEALLSYYFGSVEKGGIGLEVVTADTDPRNEATIGFLQGFGFEVTGREERTFQVGGKGGEWVDSVYLGLRREVWLERDRTIGKQRKG